ncbi:membrane protein [Kurthia sp. 3B1D]|mgnify:CR=1 FL=1|uniref:Membrane protein n=2 Tax=Kurthia TaxID=1649 RepID=A0A433RXT9_9BACL|nr:MULTISPECIES: GlsB/YeaQ/YmgE family stress response membrane protein [unclassified Kurthia]RUS58092.1 membrane protein [Kurthia sp. 3B1D]
MLSFIWYIIIGGILGWLGGLIVGKDVPGGVIGNIIAGIIGAFIGGSLLGHWGPKVSDFYILPTLLGTIILILIVSFIMKAMGKSRA